MRVVVGVSAKRDEVEVGKLVRHEFLCIEWDAGVRYPLNLDSIARLGFG